MTLLDAALELAAHGCSVIPVANDGTKRPAVNWKTWQAAPPTERDLRTWFEPYYASRQPNKYDGLGVITGAVSGHLEMLEVEGRAVHLVTQIRDRLIEAGHQGLWDRLMFGWVERSRSGGWHWFYRTEGPAARNTKLARKPGVEPDTVDVLIETRGEGGFVVAAPSAGRASSDDGAWIRLNGSPATCPTITLAERGVLFGVCNTFDKMPTIDQVTPHDWAKPASERPGDQFNATASWEDILEGWTKVRKLGDGHTWTRPGKAPRDGISATTGQSSDGMDRLYVFSTSTPFEAEKPYTKFGAYALLQHGGDYAAAARELGKQQRVEIASTPVERHLAAAPDDGPAFGSITFPEPVTMPYDEMKAAMDEAVEMGENPEPMSIFERDVLEQLYRLRVSDEARLRLQIEKQGEPRPPDRGTLAEILARPPEPPHRVEGLIPTGAFTLIVAERKTGKTTLTLGLTRSLITGDQFLGHFDVRRLDGRVGFLNYEVSAAQLGRWADEAGIPDDRLVVENLRGMPNPLAVPDLRADLVAWLKGQNVEALIVDPFSRAFVGKSQNDAADVQPFLLDLDRFREDVGASDLILTAHTGWGGERARGSSALEGHPDVTITMTRGEDKRRRYLSAEGRDVLVEERELLYNEGTRALTLGGEGTSRQESRRAEKIVNLSHAAIEIIVDEPGITVGQLANRLREQGHQFQKADPGKAVQHAVMLGQIRQENKGRSVHNYPSDWR